MTTGEKRQAARIIRNLRIPERLLFDCISQLQDAMHEDEAFCDWDGLHLMLRSIGDSLPMICSLVTNIQREVRAARNKSRKDA